MKIGYYIHHTTISAGGIFTYSIGILRELLKSTDIEKIIIITSNDVASKIQNYINDEKIETKIVDRNNILINMKLWIWYVLFFLTINFQRLIPINKFFHFLKQKEANLNPYQKIITSSKIDVLHIPVQYSPIYKTLVPVIITMHDLQEYHFPHYFSFKERLGRKIKNRMSINDSDHIIVSFNHVKNDIIKSFMIEEKKVSVCPPPFAESWFLQKNETDWSSLAKKYELEKKYLLYPAATWKHKNHSKLLEAFKEIIDDGLDYELVCTGNKTEFFDKVIRKWIKELNLSNTVHFLGIVPEEDLIGLYKNTSLVVIPTLYEAGSGPLYEAMRYQAPVI
ncbi:MAG: glycosyltransferase family 4 protein, partial [Ignavibacteria bacterium]|nr:glycosyltransferase family 4 protein [Ignavibacteria bacterium]